MTSPTRTDAPPATVMAPPPATTGDVDLAVWSAAAGGAGRRSFRRAARATTVGTAALVGFWAAVALAATTVAAGGPPTTALLPLAAAAGAWTTRTLAQHLSRRWARRGRDEVTSSLRARVLPAVLPGPEAPTAAAGPSGVQAAIALLELSDRVGAHHERARPAGAAAAPAALVVLAAVALVHWPVAVMLALATPLLAFNARLAALATADASRGQLDAVRRLSHELLDRFRGMRTLVALGAVGRERAAVERACDALNRATAAVLRRAFVVSTVTEGVITCSIAVCATYVGLVLLGYVHLPGAPPLGFAAGLLVLLLCPVYFAPLRAHAAGYHERDEALAAAGVLAPLTVRGRTAEHERADGPLLRRAPAVEISGVDVVVPNADAAVLRDVTARLPPGRIAVLSAASGQGKTTLLQVVAGLRTPTSGAVLLRDPVSGAAAAPRPGRASWIGQRTVLLPGTLAYNIALGAPDSSREEIDGAARSAGLGPLLERSDRGLDTEVGELGWGVSAGEARRVALARAVLRDAPLWLLDEPTAHLDPDTEEMVLRSVLACATGRTVLIASHSPAVVATADLVWTLDRGPLSVRSGTAVRR